jgi:hypothetical protein
MKKIIALGILVLIGCFTLPGSAKAGVTHVYRVEVSTPTDTPILLVSGAGTLYAVQCSSGATTSYSLAFDLSSATSVTIATLGSALTTQAFSSGQTASSVPNAGWKAQTGAPAQFINGLVGITHGGTINCLFYVGPPSGS